MPDHARSYARDFTCHNPSHRSTVTSYSVPNTVRRKSRPTCELALADFQWQNGYGAFAVSYSQIDQVKSYLANQEQHHRRVSFQEEFLELLRRHELEWDDQYVWD